jgi:diguanylate cyclase (GGDEF)-like protein
VITELNQEKSKAKKPKYYQVIDDLILWLSDQDLILEEQTGRIIKTLELIDEQLGSVCTNAFIHDSIIEELTALLIGIGTPRVRKTVEMIPIEPLSAKKEPSVQMSGDKWTLQVEQLRVGEWLTILCDSEGFEPMKLVWIGDFPPIFVFANRDGLNKLEFSKGELAELMRSGAANRIENLDVPLMDRATNRMLQKMHEKLIYNAIHDPVTDLFTRDEFVKQLKHEMTMLGNSGHMLCHMEIQDYRMISNICGVAGGNQLLKKLSHSLAGQLRNEELFARLGDKTFGILFKHCSPDEGYEIAKKLVNLISDSHFEWGDKSYSIGVNIGLAPFIENGYDVQQLLQQADSASISAERSGYNRIQIFKADDESLNRQNKLHEWAGQIDKTLSENRLFIRCQKIAPVEWEKNDHTHYEILLGIRDNAGNIVLPDNFIPAVERCKRMPEIDQWVIRNVFGWIEQNRNYFDQLGGFSINLSGQSINTEEFLEFLKELLASSSVPSQKITFEITESVAADSLVYVKKFIKQIKQFGCKFSLDDFGSGYSSYSYLKNLNVDYLKIDGAFVKDMANNKADVAIVKSMNEIAHSLGIKTIAEYVENNEIRDILREIGVDYVQGYGIQKPILLTELLDESSFAEGSSFAEDNGFSEDNGLADDNEFWGF